MSKVNLVKQAQEQDPTYVDRMRSLERQLAKAKSDSRLDREKLQLAERELEESQAREEVLLATDAFELVKDLPAMRPVRGKPCATPVICCNDWHAEEKVDPDTISGLNKFDLRICKKRTDKLWEKAGYLINFYRNVATVQDGVLWIGGDMMSGAIHDELEESNFLGPTEAILFVMERVVEGIRFLLKEVKLKHIRVICNYGNHGRTTQKRRVSTSHLHSWEWLAYNQIAKVFEEDDRVTFQIPKGYHAYCKIQGWDVRFQHGDNVRYQGGVGGISIPVNKALAAWNKSKHADYDIFGHWHQYLNEWRWTSCGCLVGYNAFALSIKADFQPPTQTLIFFDKAKGKTAALPIFV